MKLLTKLKKVLLFIIKQCKNILETVFLLYLYDNIKSYKKMVFVYNFLNVFIVDSQHRSF